MKRFQQMECEYLLNLNKGQTSFCKAASSQNRGNPLLNATHRPFSSMRLNISEYILNIELLFVDILHLNLKRLV